MHILCPHCRNPIEVVKLSAADEILCPSCGSSFRLETSSTKPLPDGQKLGKFQLIEEVGTGAFGTVYKAHDPELDRTVAIKVPRAGNLASDADRDRFLREARSVAQLRHPSIVAVHEVAQVDSPLPPGGEGSGVRGSSIPYLVSEFVEGITLADWLSSGRTPPPREAARLIASPRRRLAVDPACRELNLVRYFRHGLLPSLVGVALEAFARPWDSARTPPTASPASPPAPTRWPASVGGVPARFDRATFVAYTCSRTCFSMEHESSHS